MFLSLIQALPWTLGIEVEGEKEEEKGGGEKEGRKKRLLPLKHC